MRISDWSSDVCSSDLGHHGMRGGHGMMMKADTNGDKAISQTEFQTAALARFDAQDANKDGPVTAAERKAARAAKRAEWRAKRAADTPAAPPAAPANSSDASRAATGGLETNSGASGTSGSVSVDLGGRP